MNGLRTKLFLIACAIGLWAMPLSGQTQPKSQKHPKLDFSVDYLAQLSDPVGPGDKFWLQGGDGELGVDVRHGLGAAAKMTVTHVSGFGPSNISLGLLTTTFGPRYRYTPPSGNKFTKKAKVSAYGEVLVGVAHGFDSLFPDPSGLKSSATSLATQAGGGIDLGLTPHIGVRPIEANWLRTQLPNSTTNVQNNLQVGAGLVVKF